MSKNAISIIGWYGVVAILLAYALVTFTVIEAKSYAYQILNLTGAVGVVIVALSKDDKQPAILNIVWAVVAAVAIAQSIIS